MSAITRAPISLRARPVVETLEGRTVPAVGIVRPPLSAPGLVGALGPVTATPQAGMRVVSQVFVNGTLSLKVVGGVQFAGIGPAASGDQNGRTQTGGTTVVANGKVLGTFQGAPQVTREVSVVANKNGQPIKVVTYRVTGAPVVIPLAALTNWPTNGIGGVWVG